jgi:diguanylate cyclase (GGDEF)-like protein
MASGRIRGLTARTPRVLVVSTREHPVAAALEERGYTVLRAPTGAAAATKAQQVTPDAVIIQGGPSNADAVGLAQLVRDGGGLAPDAPIFILAPRAPTPAQHLAALRVGVWEFLLEPLDYDTLAATLAAHLLARDVPSQAGVDPTTGLYDVQGLTRYARELAKRAFHHRAPLACVVLASDVPGAGPDDPAVARVLMQVAESLKASGRRSDAFGRVGPNEFAVVAPGTDAKGAMKLAERLLHAVQRTAPAPGMMLRAGFDAVANVRYAPLAPEQLLASALGAMRRARARKTPIPFRAREGPSSE